MALTPELNAQISDVVEKWAEKYKNQRYAKLAKKEMRNSGELSKSLRYELHQQAQSEVKDLLFYFKEHGRWLDMKYTPAEGGKEMVDAIIEWMKSKDLNDFITKWHLKYPNRRIPKDIERRMAWGIIKKHKEQRKRRPWYAKSKTAALNELNNVLAMTLQGKYAEVIKNNFTFKKR